MDHALQPKSVVDCPAGLGVEYIILQETGEGADEVHQATQNTGVKSKATEVQNSSQGRSLLKMNQLQSSTDRQPCPAAAEIQSIEVVTIQPNSPQQETNITNTRATTSTSLLNTEYSLATAVPVPTAPNFPWPVSMATSQNVTFAQSGSVISIAPSNSNTVTMATGLIGQPQIEMIHGMVQQEMVERQPSDDAIILKPVDGNQTVHASLVNSGDKPMPLPIAGVQMVSLPAVNALASLNEDEAPLFVNAKQYHRILKRREARARLEAQGRIPKNRQKYQYKSRHLHAMNRVRGPGGKFNKGSAQGSKENLTIESDVLPPHESIVNSTGSAIELFQTMS